MQLNTAPTYTAVAAGQTAAPIAGGLTIKVYSIIVTSTAISTVNVLDSLGGTICNLAVPANISFELKVNWIAKNGLAITTPANCICTVWHGNASA